MRKRGLIRNNQSGLTLIELIVVTLILGVFIVTTGGVLLSGQRNWELNRTSMNLQSEVMEGIRTMVGEIREAGATSPQGISVVGPSNSGIQFEIPETVSSTGPQTWRSVQYGLSGASNDQLTRTDPNGTRVIANNVSSLAFTYNPANPRVVSVTLTEQQEVTDGLILQRGSLSEITVRN